MPEEKDKIEIGELGDAVIPLVDARDEHTGLRFAKYEELRRWLIEQVSWLIDRDFAHLLRALYLIDVDESRVRRLVEQHEGRDAPAIIADLILERQAQKILSRKKYIPKDGKYFTNDKD